MARADHEVPGTCSDAESGLDESPSGVELPMLRARRVDHRRIRHPARRLGALTAVGVMVASTLAVCGWQLAVRSQQRRQTHSTSASDSPVVLAGYPGYGGDQTPSQQLGPQLGSEEGYSQYPDLSPQAPQGLPPGSPYMQQPQQATGPAAAMQNFGQGLQAARGNMKAKVDDASVDFVNALARVVPVIPTRTRTQTTTSTITQTTTGLPCGFTEDNIVYPGNDIRLHPGVDVPQTCCNLCANEPTCLGWSFVKEPGLATSNMCYLKGSAPRTSVSKIYDTTFISGMPTQVGRQLPVHDTIPGQTLYCFSLVVPDTYEPAMIWMQWDQKTSIFECDEMAIYSNRVWELVPGVSTTMVDTSLQCSKGGEFGTALNTPIFLAVWQKVIEAARYQKHAWTVKVDPDAVFFPVKLRGIVAGYGETPQGTYLNNCQRGLHGPLEIFSKNAVNNWWFGKDTCKAHFEAMCGGDCQWGEDMFIDQCLMKVLGADRKFDPRLLVEEACDPPPDWQNCRLDVAAVHPFKTPEAYKACRANVLATMR